jgi:dTDP-4-amino-4,6-dideoxygalactose transaminase
MSDIPMFDYLTQYRSLRADLLAGLETVIESGRLILGEQGQRFAAGLCCDGQADKTASPVGSVTSGIVLASLITWRCGM